MSRRNRRTRKDAVPIIAAITVLACQWAYAQYWVSVGAYRAAPSAEEAAAEASERAGLAFSSRAADTAEGSVYRVVARSRRTPARWRPRCSDAGPPSPDRRAAATTRKRPASAARGRRCARRSGTPRASARSSPAPGSPRRRARSPDHGERNQKELNRQRRGLPEAVRTQRWLALDQLVHSCVFGGTANAPGGATLRGIRVSGCKTCTSDRLTGTG